MSHLHWMKLYIGDELSNTAHMTPAEFGSYIYLRMHYWKMGSLPTDDARLARIAHVSLDEWDQIKPAIGPLFEDDWRDPKLEGQREEAEDRHRKLSEAGRKGGRPRKDEKPGNKPGFLPEKASPKQPEPEPEPEPYSGSESKSDPDFRAYDEGRKGTYTRKKASGMFTPINPAASPKQSAAYLKSRGIPDDALSRAVHLHMAGELTEFEIEGFVNGDVHEGAA